MLTYCVGTHWLALVSDIVATGRTVADMFTHRLPLLELVAMCVAPQPQSSLKNALQGGWTQTDHLLANLQEGNAGLAELPERYNRPQQGMSEQRGTPSNTLFPADVYEWDDFDKRLAERYALAKEA